MPVAMRSHLLVTFVAGHTCMGQVTHVVSMLVEVEDDGLQCWRSPGLMPGKPAAIYCCIHKDDMEGEDHMGKDHMCLLMLAGRTCR
jgi:hypothetical protein